MGLTPDKALQAFNSIVNESRPIDGHPDPGAIKDRENAVRGFILSVRANRKRPYRIFSHYDRGSLAGSGRSFYIKARVYRSFLEDTIQALKNLNPLDFKESETRGFPKTKEMIKQCEFEILKWNRAVQSPKGIGEYRALLKKDVESFVEKTGKDRAGIEDGEIWVLQQCLRQFEKFAQWAELSLAHLTVQKRRSTNGRNIRPN